MNALGNDVNFALTAKQFDTANSDSVVDLLRPNGALFAQLGVAYVPAGTISLTGTGVPPGLAAGETVTGTIT